MKKHILVISQYFYPEQFRINDICEELVRRGNQVTVITGMPNYPEGKIYKGYGLFSKRKETFRGISIIRLPIIPRGKNSVQLFLNYMSFVVSGYFWNKFTSIKADQVFIFEVSPMSQALLGVWYAQKFKVSCYLYVQDLWPENVEIVTGIHNPIILGNINKMVDYIYKNCTKILTTSPSFVEKISARSDAYSDRVVYWPQYAEEFYKPVDVNLSMGRESERIPVIMFTGNIGYAQGLDILPEAAAVLNMEGFECKFCILGDGRYRKELESKVKNVGVTNMFEFYGRKEPEEIPLYLSNADFAFLSFADNELFSSTIPAKLQSYMACGIPMIGVVSGESARIITEANCGWVTPLGDHIALVETIKIAIESSSEERKAMRMHAISYCKEHFDKKTLMDKLEFICE